MKDPMPFFEKAAFALMRQKIDAVAADKGTTPIGIVTMIVVADKASGRIDPDPTGVVIGSRFPGFYTNTRCLNILRMAQIALAAMVEEQEEQGQERTEH